MFGKDQPDVVTDKDVGDYVEQLRQQGNKEVQKHIHGDDDGLGNVSKKPKSGRKDTS